MFLKNIFLDCLGQCCSTLSLFSTLLSHIESQSCFFNCFCRKNQNKSNMKTMCQAIDVIPNIPGQIVLISFNIFLAITATLGNALIIASTLKSNHLRSQTPTYFILSLAISDFLVGLVVQPLYALILIDWSSKTCHIHYYKFAIAFFTCSVSIGNGICVCLDRMLHITKPFHYDNYVTKKRALALCITIWVSGVGIGVMAIQPVTELLIAYGAASEMGVSLLTWTYCALKIYDVGQEQIERISQTNTAVDAKKKILMERKLALSLAAVLATIVICWIPFAIVNLILLHTSSDTSEWKLIFEVRLWTVFFGYSKSTINIFIFGLTNRDIKKAIRNSLGFRKARLGIAMNASTKTTVSNKTSYGSTKKNIEELGLDNQAVDK